MQTNSFNDHAANATHTQEYINLRNVGGLTPAIWWVKEESAIKQTLGLMLPNTMFNRTKAIANVHDAWEILKWVYEE